MATYGSIPGVRIETSTGVVSGVTIGREQYLVLIGVGNDSATAAVNEPVSIECRSDADELFGADSDVASAYRDALANGANPTFVQGIRAETTTESETFTSSAGKLANAPIVPDPSRVSVDDDGDLLTVEFRYESTVPAPNDENTIFINPHTGDFDAEASSDPDLTIEYDHADWESATAAAYDAVGEAEFGVINPLTHAETVGLDLQSVITEMRGDMKMVVGVMGAEPNASGDDGTPRWDTGSFTSGFSDDTMFLAAPTALDNSADNALYGAEGLPAIAGLFAGNSNTNPVYNDALSGVGSFAQRLSRSEVGDLRDQYVIPVRDTGTARLMDNHSTYDQETDGGWERDYFRRRIVDLTTATIYQIARRQIGSILDSETVEDVQDALDVEISDLVDDGLLEAGAQELNVYRADDRTIGIDATITPYGVMKGAEVELQVNA